MKQAQYKEMINNEIAQGLRCGEKTIKLRVIYVVGRYSRKSYSADHTNTYCNYLDELKLKYTLGNDSPRGGQTGKYIEVKLDKRNAFIKTLCDSMKQIKK